MRTTVIDSTSRLLEGAPVAHTDCGPIPHFKFMPPRVVNNGFGSLAIGDEAFHRINNLGSFYDSLGFKDKEGGALLPEEFIWDRYTSDGALMSRQCLQIQITNYLFIHSARFKEKYGCAYEKMIGTCKSEKIDNRDIHCAKCPMHPALGH